MSHLIYSVKWLYRYFYMGVKHVDIKIWTWSINFKWNSKNVFHLNRSSMTSLSIWWKWGISSFYNCSSACNTISGKSGPVSCWKVFYWCVFSYAWFIWARHCSISSVGSCQTDSYQEWFWLSLIIIIMMMMIMKYLSSANLQYIPEARCTKKKRTEKG